MFFSVMTKNLNWETKNLVSRAWITCRFNRGLGKSRGYVFEVGAGRGLRPQCTLWVQGVFLFTQISTAISIVRQYYY